VALSWHDLANVEQMLIRHFSFLLVCFVNRMKNFLLAGLQKRDEGIALAVRFAAADSPGVRLQSLCQGQMMPSDSLGQNAHDDNSFPATVSNGARTCIYNTYFTGSRAKLLPRADPATTFSQTAASNPRYVFRPGRTLAVIALKKLAKGFPIHRRGFSGLREISAVPAQHIFSAPGQRKIDARRVDAPVARRSW
jgi:hypothetical protein